MRADRASRLLPARADQVFDAFLDPEVLVRWLPPQGMHAHLEQWDPAAGYRMVLTYDHAPDGGGKASADTDVSVVRRVTVDAPRLLVEEVQFPSGDPAFAGTMRLTWTFDEQDGGTLVTVEATEVPEGIAPEDHVGAMIASLTQLAAVLR